MKRVTAVVSGMSLVLGMASAVQAGASLEGSRPDVDMIQCGVMNSSPGVATKAESYAMVPVNCPADEYLAGLCYSLEYGYEHLMPKFGCPTMSI